MTSSAIAQAFSHAASQYQQAAQVQTQVAEHLIKQIESLVTNDFAEQKPIRICDLGCGPGSCLTILRDLYPSVNFEYTGVDIAQGMIEYAKTTQPDANWVQSDMRALPFEAQQFDIVISSSSMQWLDSLEPTFNEIKRVLTPQGAFCFSLYIEGTLAHLKRAFATLDNAQHVNSFFTERQVKQTLEQTGFAQPSIENKQYRQTFPSALALMKSLKEVGANTVVSRKEAQPFTRRKLQLLEQQLYQQQGEPLYAEYQSLFVITRMQ